MTPAAPSEQKNPYKGSPERPGCGCTGGAGWFHLGTDVSGRHGQPLRTHPQPARYGPAKAPRRPRREHQLWAARGRLVTTCHARAWVDAISTCLRQRRRRDGRRSESPRFPRTGWTSLAPPDGVRRRRRLVLGPRTSRAGGSLRLDATPVSFEFLSMQPSGCRRGYWEQPFSGRRPLAGRASSSLPSWGVRRVIACKRRPGPYPERTWHTPTE